MFSARITPNISLFDQCEHSTLGGQVPHSLEISLVATELNRRSGPHPIGQLQVIRKALKRFAKLPSKAIFTKQTIHEDWACHLGGRTELQFNIGREITHGRQELRRGVAFSFELSQTLPDIDVLVPKARLFNEYLQMYPEQFADMRMWHYRNGVRSDDYAPSAILAELVTPHVFVFLGKRQATAEGVEYDAILSDFDRLLPLYKYVEGGCEKNLVTDPSGFQFRPGRTIRAESASVRLAERELNITLRHNRMQEVLYQRLVAAHGAEQVRAEQPSGLGTLIDVALRVGDEQYWYYEIKTASSPRACLREALGQILEYSFWPGAQEGSRLIVCGENELDNDGAAYLRQLQTRFSLPIAYERITCG